MKPTTYTEIGDTIQFHYSVKDLRKFMKIGKEEGNSGVIITKKEGSLITYRGFGTIENPCKSLLTLVVAHSPAFSGEFNIDAIMNPKPIFTKENSRIVMLDFGKLPPFLKQKE